MVYRTHYIIFVENGREIQWVIISFTSSSPILFLQRFPTLFLAVISQFKQPMQSHVYRAGLQDRTVSLLKVPLFWHVMICRCAKVPAASKEHTAFVFSVKQPQKMNTLRSCTTLRPTRPTTLRHTAHD